MSDVENVECVVGADVAGTLTLLDMDGNAITTYSSAATLAAKCWMGDDQTLLFAPTVAWLDPSAGTVSYSHTAAQTASIDPGNYKVQLWITAGSLTHKHDVVVLHFNPAPGSATAPTTYCTRKDLMRLAPWIETTQDLARDKTNFAEQRGAARVWLDNIIMDRVEEILMDQRSRHGPIQEVAPIVPTDGYDYGPTWGPSTIPDTTLRDQLAVYRAYLIDDRLMRRGDDGGSPTPRVFDPDGLDGGQVERLTAHYALYQILDAQIGARGDDTSYQSLAKEHYKRAIREVVSWIALIDTDADGVPDFRIASI